MKDLWGKAEPGKHKLVAILLHLFLLNPYSQASPYDASLAKQDQKNISFHEE